MRRLLRPALSAALLAATLPALAQAPAAEAPTVVLDDFADPATGWTVRRDGTAYEINYRDGAYWIAMATRTPLQLASAGHIVADGRVAIRLRDLAPSAPHPAGLFVRAQDPANFYAFVVGSDGSFVVFHYVDGAFVLDSPDGAMVPAGLYLPGGAANDVAVDAGARRLIFYLNGVELFRVEDALWTEGVAGLVAANVTDTPAGTVFDNWRIERFTCPMSPRPVCAPTG